MPHALDCLLHDWIGATLEREMRIPLLFMPASGTQKVPSGFVAPPLQDAIRVERVIALQPPAMLKRSDGLDANCALRLATNAHNGKILL